MYSWLEPVEAAPYIRAAVGAAAIVFICIMGYLLRDCMEMKKYAYERELAICITGIIFICIMVYLLKD